MDKAGNNVLIGMSGGVDSSVAACLLKEQGFAVFGVTMNLFGESTGAEDAAKVADRLGIDHHTISACEAFRCNVVEPFVSEYLAGRTPNPCIRCNRTVKFALMAEHARTLGMDYVATGHYARRGRSGDRYLLLRGRDREKDQSYFLYTLTQAQLACTLFPLGDMEKGAVRELAEKYGLSTAEKKDSQDICFIPEGDYGAFIAGYTGEEYPAGNFADRDGRVLGRHRGHIRYTIGQRRGLELSMGRRVYVTGKDPQRNLVYIGEDEDLFHRGVEAGEVNFIPFDRLEGPLKCTARIRHSKQEAEAVAEPVGEDRIKVTFSCPQRAPAPGQAVVLYDGDVVLGGGTILRAFD